MADLTADDHDSDQHALAVGAYWPAMPAVPAAQLYREPVLIGYGTPHSIGWQDARKVGPCFVVVHIGALTGNPRVLERFPLTGEGWALAWAALVKIDEHAARTLAPLAAEKAAAGAAARAERVRQAQLYAAIEQAGSQRHIFAALRAQVLFGDDLVYTLGAHDAAAGTDSSRLLGPLAGTEAVVTDGSQAWSPGRAMFLPVALAGLATKTMAHAALVFADGSVHTTELNGNSAVREAQVQAVQFNALASAPQPTRPAAADNDPGARLRKLRDLLDAGLISQDEYNSKRAEIIKLI